MVLTAANEFHDHLVAWFVSEQGVYVGVGQVEGNTADAGDDITLLQVGLAGRTVGSHIGDIHAPLRRQAVGAGNIRGDGLETDPKIGMRDRTGLNKLFGNCPGSIDRDGKAQPFRHGPAAAAAHDQGVDGDHFTRQVDQRTARVTLVDGGIGLDQVVDGVAVAGIDGPSRGADHALCDGVLEIAQRRADGDDRLARM